MSVEVVQSYSVYYQHWNNLAVFFSIFMKMYLICVSIFFWHLQSLLKMSPTAAGSEHTDTTETHREDKTWQLETVEQRGIKVERKKKLEHRDTERTRKPKNAWMLHKAGTAVTNEIISV